MVSHCSRRIFLAGCSVIILSVGVTLSSAAGDKGVKLDDVESTEDKKAVLSRPLTQGIYQFEADGFVRTFDSFFKNLTLPLQFFFLWEVIGNPKDAFC